MITRNSSLTSHEVRQGFWNGDTNFSRINIPMMEIVEEIVPRCVVQLPMNPIKGIIHMLIFFDDKRHYVNNVIQ